MGQTPRTCPEHLSRSPEFPKGKEGTTFSSASVLLNKENSWLFHKKKTRQIMGNYLQKCITMDQSTVLIRL